MTGRRFGGIKVTITKVTATSEDLELVNTIPTNDEATLERAHREAAALLRLGEKRVWILVNRIKQPSGVFQNRFYCVTEAVRRIVKQFRPSEVVAEYPLPDPPCQPTDKPTDQLTGQPTGEATETLTARPSVKRSRQAPQSKTKRPRR